MPRKLVRDRNNSPEHEMEIVTDKLELNNLYFLKALEEIEEIRMSDFKDIKEYGDLFQVILNWAELNGINAFEISEAMSEKGKLKGEFSNKVLTNLNPENPSNKIYFDIEKQR